MLAQHIKEVSLVVGLASVAGGVALGLWLNRQAKAHALSEIQHTVLGFLLLAAGAMLAHKGLEWLTVALNNWTEVMQSEVASGRFESGLKSEVRLVGIVALSTVAAVGLSLATGGVTVVAFAISRPHRDTRPTS